MMQTSSIVFIVAALVFTGYVIIFVSMLRDSQPTSNDGLQKEDIPYLKKTIEGQNKLIVKLEEKLARGSEGASVKEIAKTEGAGDQKESSTSMSRSSRTSGVVVLGMHRSGTSILGGLVNKMGLNVGGPLIQPGTDNEKGFFERIDAVLQNDYMMKKQGIHYGYRTEAYNSQTALYHAIIGMRGGGHALTSPTLVGKGDNTEIEPNFFNEGKRALNFLNDPNNYPWMLKDPRLCITIRTWLPLMNFVPAILFTYRHPMDVALSLHNRAQEHYRMGKGLRMWYVYNMRAIQHSNDLCRVVGSHRRVMESPQQELARLRRELIDRCGLAVPRDLTGKEIAEFVDPHLQHGHNTQTDNPCTHPDGKAHLQTILPPAAQWETQDPAHIALYREVMRVYCAMEDGTAFAETFSWDLTMKDT